MRTKRFVIDTHVFIKYISGISLRKQTEGIFTNAEHGKCTIFIPCIVIAEILYLVKKNKIMLNYSELIRRIEISDNFVLIPLDLNILKILPEIELSEIHDQIIVATTKFLHATLLTEDKEIIKSNIVPVM